VVPRRQGDRRESKNRRNEERQKAGTGKALILDRELRIVIVDSRSRTAPFVPGIRGGQSRAAQQWMPATAP